MRCVVPFVDFSFPLSLVALYIFLLSFRICYLLVVTTLYYQMLGRINKLAVNFLLFLYVIFSRYKSNLIIEIKFAHIYPIVLEYSYLEIAHYNLDKRTIVLLYTIFAHFLIFWCSRITFRTVLLSIMMIRAFSHCFILHSCIRDNMRLSEGIFFRKNKIVKNNGIFF